MYIGPPLENTKAEQKLFKAAHEGDLIAIEKALQEGAHIEAVHCQNGFSALRITAKKHRYACMRFLLQRGACPNECDRKGYYPLHFAAEEGCIDLIKMLIDEYGAYHQNYNYSGETPLFRAVYREQVESVRILLERGAEVNITNIKGYTLLELAEDLGNREIIKMLNAAQYRNEQLVNHNRRVNFLSLLLYGYDWQQLGEYPSPALVSEGCSEKMKLP